MRKFVVSIALSADGYIARRDGSVDWLDRPRPPGNYGMGAFMQSIDTIVWGRKTYDMAMEMVGSDGFDRKVRNCVFTRRPPATAPAGVEFVTEPVREFARGLRASPGKDVWMMGGASMIASFLDAGEIDEFMIHVVPVLIGEGIPMLAPRHRTVPLALMSSESYPDGVVRLHFAVKRAGSRAPGRRGPRSARKPHAQARRPSRENRM